MWALGLVSSRKQDCFRSHMRPLCTEYFLQQRLLSIRVDVMVIFTIYIYYRWIDGFCGVARVLDKNGGESNSIVVDEFIE